jgi:hypothetical protein
MPRKHSDDTVYTRVDGKYVAVGKWFDRDFLGFGDYFVQNNKYTRGYRWIGAFPDADFIGLETALEESRDNIDFTLRDIVQKSVLESDQYQQRYYLVDNVIQAIRKTYLDKKKKMLDIIKNENL